MGSIKLNKTQINALAGKIQEEIKEAKTVKEDSKEYLDYVAEVKGSNTYKSLVKITEMYKAVVEDVKAVMYTDYPTNPDTYLNRSITNKFKVTYPSITTLETEIILATIGEGGVDELVEGIKQKFLSK